MPHARAIAKTIIACVIVYIIFKICILFLSPFLLAVLISILTEPIIKIFINKFQLNRTISIITALLLFCILALTIVFNIIYSIYKEILIILKNIPYIYEILNDFFQRVYLFIERTLNIDILKQNITGLTPDKLLYSAMNLLISLKNTLLHIINSLPNITIYITFSIIASFFISRDKDKILKLSFKYLPKYIINIVSKLYKSIKNIVKTECILILIGMAQALIGFLLLNNKYAIILSILCGIVDILPVIGMGIIFIPWFVYCLLKKNIIYAVALLCLYLIIMITRRILETRMISGKLNVHPLIILISMYIGLKFFGVMGAVLGPLISVILKEIYQETICEE